MIEVMPFLHIICQRVIDNIGADKPKEIIATIMVAYVISTLLTGTVFYLLGLFKLVKHYIFILNYCIYIYILIFFFFI